VCVRVCVCVCVACLKQAQLSHMCTLATTHDVAVCMCCSVLQFAVCCSALQCACVAVCDSVHVLQCVAVCMCCSVLQCAVCCSVHVLQCVAVCSVLQCLRSYVTTSDYGVATISRLLKIIGLF